MASAMALMRRSRRSQRAATSAMVRVARSSSSARMCLPGDHQPRQPLLHPGQALSQLGDPPAQFLRLRPGRRLPALQLIDQRPHQAPSLLLPETVEAGRRQQ
jgi:hypothetical protein